MTSSWITKTVGDCLVPVSVRGKGKIATRDYKPNGRFPVIDQSQAAIAGWTSDQSAVIDSPLPLIVFGDHTRALKYVEQPFARGADGTQLLCPTSDIDPLFFYFACRSIDLSARGYNRHFTLLKEQEFSLPTDPLEQTAIARAMRRVENATQNQAAIVDVLGRIQRLTRQLLFSRGLRGDSLVENGCGLMPSNWKPLPFDEVFTIAQGQVDPKEEPYSSMLHVGPDNIEPNTGHLLPCVTAGSLGLISGKYEFSVGDIVYSKIRPHLNKVAMPTFAGVCSADMYPLKVRGSILPRFAFHYLLSESFLDQAVPFQRRTGIPKINREQLASTSIPEAPESEQREIVSILDAIERRLDHHRRKHGLFEQMCASLLQHLMARKIRIEDLDLSALSGPEEALA